MSASLGRPGHFPQLPVPQLCEAVQGSPPPSAIPRLPTSAISATLVPSRDLATLLPPQQAHYAHPVTCEVQRYNPIPSHARYIIRAYRCPRSM